MIYRAILTALVGAFLALSANAEIVVRVRPPARVVERRMAAPGRGYVWTPGFHRWDGNAYAWSPGVWVAPPRRGARWVQPRWVHRRGTWVFIEGRWR